MASREHREITPVCKGCGATGKADVYENEQAYTPLERSVVISEGPFECIDDDRMKFRCTKCGTEF